MNQPKPRLALALTHTRPPSFTDRYNNIGTFVIAIRQSTDNYNWNTTGHDYTRLHIKAYYYITAGVPTVYGYELRQNVEYIESLNYDFLKLLTEQLGRLNKKLDAITKEWGSPDTFGAYLIRVAKVIGADCMLTFENSRGEPYKHSTFQEIQVNEINLAIQYRLESAVDAWTKANAPAKVDA